MEENWFRIVDVFEYNGKQSIFEFWFEMKSFVFSNILPISAFSPGQDVFNDVQNNGMKIFESIVDVAGTVSLTIYVGFDSVIVGFDNLE